MLPLGRDQHINADRVAQFGAGIHLARDASTERIRDALEQLTTTPSFREAAAAASARITADRPDRSAVWAVQAAVRPGATAISSPGRALAGYPSV
jgi:UDP:flavonoid glycosyltransferase YjiC (YdhE family)